MKVKIVWDECYPVFDIYENDTGIEISAKRLKWIRFLEKHYWKMQSYLENKSGYWKRFEVKDGN